MSLTVSTAELNAAFPGAPHVCSYRQLVARALVYVGTWLELLHSRCRASELGSNSSFPISKVELGSNSSIPDSKRRNLDRTPPFPILRVRTRLELLHFRFQASELGSNSSIPDSKRRNWARTAPFPIPSVRTWLKLLHFRFQASNLARTPPFPIQSVRTWLEILHYRFQASELGSNSRNHT